MAGQETKDLESQEFKDYRDENFKYDLWGRSKYNDILRSDEPELQREALREIADKLENLIQFLDYRVEKGNTDLAKELNDKKGQLDEIKVMINLEKEALKNKVVENIQRLPIMSGTINDFLKLATGKDITWWKSRIMEKAEAIKKRVSSPKPSAPTSPSLRPKVETVEKPQPASQSQKEEQPKAASQPSTQTQPKSQSSAQTQPQQSTPERGDERAWQSQEPRDELAHVCGLLESQHGDLRQGLQLIAAALNTLSKEKETPQMVMDVNRPMPGERGVLGDENDFNNSEIIEAYSAGIPAMLRKIPKEPGNTVLTATLNKTILTR